MENKKIIKAVKRFFLPLVILFSLILYRFFVIGISTVEFVIYTLIIIGIIIFYLLFSKIVLNVIKKVPLDQVFNTLGLMIAIIAFIETIRQANNNNIQFEENRKASDSVFKVQLKHSKQLNDSLINELNKIQDINKNQFLTSEENLKLTKQSLQDYIIETRANLSLGKSSISISDTLDTGELKIVISENISNIGKRIAKHFEVRQSIVFNNRKIGKLSLNSGVKEVLPSEPKEVHHSFVISKKEYENFYYWVQIRYYDERLDKLYDRSKYFHFYKTDKGYDFYYVSLDEKNILRKIIDKELNEKGLSLTID